MNNKSDFAKRLERVNGQKTVAISRSTSVTPLAAGPIGKKAKKDKNGGHSITYILCLFVVVTLGVFRALTFMSDIDLEKRHASLVDGNSQEQKAAFVLSVVMVADPLVLPLFDKATYAAVDADKPTMLTKIAAVLSTENNG